MEAVSSGLGTSSLWSFTPARSLVASSHKSFAPASILIACSGQIGHILETIIGANRPTNLYVHYSGSESLARELLLLSIAFDFDISLEERSEMFLEVFANIKLREKTFTYLRQISKELLRVVRREGDNRLQSIVDLSNLKYRNLDDLEQNIIDDCRQQECNLDKLREHRLRGYYGERYDVRLNLIDWDYIMNLKKHASIIHKLHFTEWRMLGQAFEVREAKYTIPNRTMLTYRDGKKKSTMASVKVLGYWGDIVASPYLTFGTEAADRPDLFELQGDQHKNTACDVSRYNVQRLFEVIQKSGTNVKIIPIADLNRAKFENSFDCVLMPMQSSIQLHDLGRFIRQNCQILVETVKFIPCLSDKNKLEYESGIREMVKQVGWLIADHQSGEQPEKDAIAPNLQTFLHFIAA